jgi:2-polyprenyl-6-methoxyphenol hydroxylase-like FAD-dependent oxidoreductase
LTFQQAEPRDVDLLIGADGLHSRVRDLAFGAETRFEVPLGYHVAAFELADADSVHRGFLRRTQPS